MVQFLVIAIRNLLKNRGRSLIIGGAIASVTALLVLLLSVTAGMRNTILTNATALMTGHVNIAGFYKISQTSATPVITRFRELHELAVKNVPEATLIIDRLKAYGKIISDSNSIMFPMSGINMKNERPILGNLALAKKRDYIENYAPKPGEPETEGNLLDIEKPGNLVLFTAHAKKLKVRVGDIVTLSMPTYRNIYNTKDVRVAAILQDMGMLSNYSIFLNHDDTREIYQMAPDSTGQIMIYLRSLSDVKKVEERLRKLVAARGFALMDKDSQPYWMKFDRVSGESWTGQKIDITTWQDETSFIKWVLDIFNTVTILATVILMVIVVLGLTNALWMSVRERTNEIGTLRAIGLQRRQVMLMFFLESLVLSLASTLAGLAAGGLLCGILNLLRIPITSDAIKMFLMSDTLTLSIEPGSLLMILILITVFLVLGAIYPSYKASKMKPVTAINHIN